MAVQGEMVAEGLHPSLVVESEIAPDPATGTPVNRAELPTSPPTGGQPKLRVRVVDRATGEAIAGCEVRAGTPDSELRGWTDRQGRLEILLPLAATGPTNPTNSQVLFSAPGYATHGAYAVLDRGPVDLGTVELVHGVRVSGTVRSESGTPLPGLKLSISTRPDLTAPIGEPIVREYLRITTGAPGNVQADKLLLPGELRVSPSQEFDVVSTSTDSLESGQTATHLEIVLAEITEILEGIVVDNEGKPVPEMLVLSGKPENGRRRGLTGEAQSGLDGRFKLYPDTE
jgi:hypothetical protein